MSSIFVLCCSDLPHATSPYARTSSRRVKVAMVSALSQGAFKEGDLLLCLTGRIGREVDTLSGHVDLRRPLPKNLAWVQ